MSVPKAMQIQLARIFGNSSIELKTCERSDSQWKRTLQKMLDELFKYAENNIDTDQFHWFMICSGFAAASESLKDEEFWPGYTEGIMRVCYLLMGDYPDHRNYKGGRKKDQHYSLNALRTSTYLQTPKQKKKTIYVAANISYPSLEVNPRDAMSEFRAEKGSAGNVSDFIKWFKRRYPSDYAALF